MTDQNNHWQILLGLQQRIFEAKDIAELCFLAANEIWHLIPYQQACIFVQDRLGRTKLQAISGLATCYEETPFTLWLKKVFAAVRVQADRQDEQQRFTGSFLSEELQNGWKEWWPGHALYQPFVTPSGKVVGGAFYVRDTPWQDEELALFNFVHRGLAYAINALKPSISLLVEQWGRVRQSFWKKILLAAILLGLLSFPIQLSVLAPAEIIALKSEVVSAPLDGVINTFHVRPNQTVAKDDLLLSLDDTTLRNHYKIALRALAVARADLLAAERKAFDSPKSKSELTLLTGKVREKEAEVTFLRESLERIHVRAAQDGIFIYGDPNDWLGKPVVTGERIAQLAQPKELGVMVWVAAGDAIALDSGAAMKVYLQTAPFNVIRAEVVETSYQATLSPANIVSYRLRGRLKGDDTPHIGLQGVAKVYGGWHPLAYWLLRRPLGTLRQWTGF